MSYLSSPQPTFSGPAPIPYEQVKCHRWGDHGSGEFADWSYVSSGEIHQLVFGLPVSGALRHSDQHRTIFASDELFFVIAGALALTNPESGEVHRVTAGEAAFFRRDTWHHCFSCGTEPLRVLEYFAPLPAQGTSELHAQSKQDLTTSHDAQDQWLGQWPIRMMEARARWSIQVLREPDLLWRLEGQQRRILVGLYASTENLTVGRVQLLAGQRSDSQCHPGDECLYVLQGQLNIHLPEHGGQRWYELGPRDGFYLPRGIPHQYHNIAGDPAAFMFGVAPHYI
jgi:quercetin dioxygenase-like cupin family protein